MNQKSPTVLIADDEAYIIHVLAIKLRNADYETLTAADGEEALQLALVEQPDLIITDFQMPYLTGPEVLRELAHRTGHRPPSILITAREFELPETDADAPRPDLVLAKPFSPRQVIRYVEDLLARTRLQPTARAS